MPEIDDMDKLGVLSDPTKLQETSLLTTLMEGKQEFKPIEKPRPKSYIGTKVVTARPMTKEQFSGSEIDGLNPQGYEVTYEDGYVSWSPKEVFERCYREITSAEKGLI